MAIILIVDAESASRSFFAWLLGQHGHRVIEVGSGEDAQTLLAVERPNLILADILMAAPAGYRLALHVAGLHGPKPALVFHAPTCVASEAGALALACGVRHVVSAKADPDHLTTTIEQALAAPTSEPIANPDVLCACLHALASALHRWVSLLEASNVWLEQQASEWAEQLDSARDALSLEVSKRLQQEQALNEANRQLQAQVVRDPLTGLYNRRYLEESLAREESRARRSIQPLGIMMIDIDHFKRYNDNHGHAAGDQVLRHVARQMECLARNEDILCRYGGEEFVLVMANASPETLRERAEELLSGVGQLSLQHEGRPLGALTLSIGIAIFPTDAESAAEVLAVADAAMYQAKSAGRNRVVVGGRQQAKGTEQEVA
ncbi:MAG TPA: diguanylate cyclase [Rhodocyclaceae bacterium]|nr:diguanylate cyclase [Rhodocyclaceae bacterium]